jgi:hypothetical protein
MRRVKRGDKNMRTSFMAIAIFALGAMAGHAVSSSQKISGEAAIAQISTFDLTLKAGSLPVQTANAI